MEARLIPGLPDCVALHCLLHLPFHAIPAARAVCKRWNHELTSPSFYRLRSATGLAHVSVVMLFRGKFSHTVGKLYLALYEPATGICMIRQLAANCTKNSKRWRCNHGAIFGRELMVFGGWDVLKNCRSGEVHIYDLVSGAWRTGAPMPGQRPLRCRFGFYRGKLFVVGRINSEGKKLRSTLVYDMAIDTWLEVPDLEQNTCQGSLGDQFWGPKEKYKRAIQWCKMLWLLDYEKSDVRLNLTTVEEKEIIVVDVPKIKIESNEIKMESFTLSTHALETLLGQLGFLPNEIGRYIESLHMGHL